MSDDKVPLPQKPDTGRRYWVSWEERSADYRPLTYPPNAAILGWWKSGEAGDGSHSTICAWVTADNEDAAKASVVKDWPGANRVWRFILPVDMDWCPGDRFPLPKWGFERLESR